MLDNLRRSLLAPLSLLALALCWMLSLPAALIGTLLVLGALAIPGFLPLCFTLLPSRSGVSAQSHLHRLLGDLRMAASQTLLNLAFLRSEEHTSELQSLMRISYAVFCLKKKNN